MSNNFSISLEAEKFADWIRLFSEINDIETPLGVDQGRLFTTIMEPQHTYMLKFEAKNSIFDEFESKNAEIGIDPEELAKIFKIYSREKNTGDSLNIRYNGRDLMYTLKSPLQRTKRRFFFLSDSTSLISDKYELPDLDYTVKITLNAEIFKKIIQECCKISDKFTLFYNDGVDNSFWASAYCGTSCSYIAEIEDFEKIESTGEAKGEHSLSPIVDILPFLRDNITIYLGHEIPLRIDFNLWGAECSYCLAPRAEKKEREGEVCNK